MGQYEVKWGLAIVLMVVQCIYSTNAMDITITGGGYEGIVVAINRHLPEDPKLIDGIKEMFNRGSGYLFNATGNRLFYKKVTIVIPESWKGNYNQETVFTDYYSKSHIRVAPENPEFGDAPYTLQPGGCGEQGEYTHFTPKFLTEISGWTEEMYGDAGRQLVHEWSHFRYGVFDEYGTPGNSRFPLFYLDGGKILPTSCVRNVSGWIEQEDGSQCKIYKNSFVDANCRFIPDMDELRQSAPASIMYMPFLPKVGSFCNGNAEEASKHHNWRAPTKQNAFCEFKSTWEVISQHPDIKTSVVLPPSTSTKTTFQVVRFAGNQARRTVLVLDVSTSMAGQSRLRKLQAAAQRFIADTVPTGTLLGMVEFSSQARTLVGITRVENENVRKQLIGFIPQRVNGATSVGAGLLEALKVLRANSGSTEGAMIILITDGEETNAPYINQVTADIDRSRVMVNTIAIGNSATKLLENLATRSGGRSFFFPDNDPDASRLDSALVSSTSSQVDVELQPITVLGDNVQLSAGKSKTTVAIIDKELGKNAQFTFQGASINNVLVTLTSPSNKVYDESSSEFDADVNGKQRKKYGIPVAEPGKWTITYLAKTDVRISATVTSEVKDEKDQPVRAHAWFDKTEVSFPAYVKVFAEVTKNYNKILNATVKATIVRPNANDVEIILKDNGAGADSIKDDGIYSGFFGSFTGNGRYAAIATVINDGNAKLKISGGQKSGQASRAPSIPKDRKNLDAVPRTEFYMSDFTQVPGSIPEPVIETVPADDFSRNVDLGNFQLKEFIAGSKTDSIPPSRVTDLGVYFVGEARNIQYKAQLPKLEVVHLSWTAAGDDLDAGIADRVEIRGSLDGDSFVRSFANGMEVSFFQTQMVAAGNRQTAQFSLPEEWNVTSLIENGIDVYFAIVTIDKQGNRGGMSNIATAHFGYSTDENSKKNVTISDNEISISEENTFFKTLTSGNVTSKLSIGEKNVTSISFNDENNGDSTVKLTFVRSKNVTIRRNQLKGINSKLLKMLLSQ